MDEPNRAGRISAVVVRLESAIAAPDKVWAVAVLEIAPARGAAAELSRASIAAAARRAAPASAAAPAGAAVAAVVDPAAAAVEAEVEGEVEVGVDGDNRAVGKCWFQVSGVRELGEGRTSE